jgi:hypothetical protein
MGKFYLLTKSRHLSVAFPTRELRLMYKNPTAGSVHGLEFGSCFYPSHYNTTPEHLSHVHLLLGLTTQGEKLLLTFRHG